MDYKFVELKPADNNKNKLTAIFYNVNTKKFKRVHFGAKGYNDFTTFEKTIRDDKKRLYKARHKGDNLDDPISRGSLSWHILWGNHPSIQKNLTEYINKFNL